MASSQSDVTGIPSPLRLLQLTGAFPRGVFVFWKSCCCSRTPSAGGPAPSPGTQPGELEPGTGARGSPGRAGKSWSTATLLRTGGRNSTDLELLCLKELIGGMR